MTFHLSQQRIAEVANARAIASSRDEMARLLHISPDSAGSYITRLNLERFRRVSKDPGRNEAIKALHADGESLGYIARELGTTKNVVVGVLHRAGLTKPRPPRKDYISKPRTRTTMRSLPVFQTIPFNARTAPIEPLHIAFADLKSFHCREAYGDEPHDFTFCGHPVVGGRSYCVHHAAINYRAAPAVERNARPR